MSDIETRLHQVAQRILDDGTIQEDMDTLSEAASTIAQLRRAVEALRDGLLSFTEIGCPCSDCARARAILAEIDGKEPTDGK